MKKLCCLLVVWSVIGAAFASSALLVDHVAVTSPCAPYKWTTGRQWVCDGIVFRNGFDPQ